MKNLMAFIALSQFHLASNNTPWDEESIERRKRFNLERKEDAKKHSKKRVKKSKNFGKNKKKRKK